VQKLKDEMRELQVFVSLSLCLLEVSILTVVNQDRQARIENLLLVLTRGMRNDGGGSPRRPTS
jgi:hypothetical protein